MPHVRVRWQAEGRCAEAVQELPAVPREGGGGDAGTTPRAEEGSMTSHTLATWLLAGADRPIVVAGHGQLAAVTHGATTDGDQVVVLYVEQGEAECAPTGADGRDGADGTGSVSGAASGVALETPSVGDVSSVRADSAGDAGGHVDVQPGLWS